MNLNPFFARIELMRLLTAMLYHIGRRDETLRALTFQLADLVKNSGDLAVLLPTVGRILLDEQMRTRGATTPATRVAGAVLMALIGIRDQTRLPND